MPIEATRQEALLLYLENYTRRAVREKARFEEQVEEQGFAETLRWSSAALEHAARGDVAGRLHKAVTEGKWTLERLQAFAVDEMTRSVSIGTARSVNPLEAVYRLAIADFWGQLARMVAGLST